MRGERETQRRESLSVCWWVLPEVLREGSGVYEKDRILPASGSKSQTELDSYQTCNLKILVDHRFSLFAYT